MKKIFKNLKPYTAVILIAISLLFVQAFADLRLPKYMSNIVNVGIQQSGIDHASPKEMSVNAHDLIVSLLPETQSNEFKQGYEMSGDAYRLKSDVDRDALDILVGESVWTLLSLDTKSGAQMPGMGENVEIKLSELYPLIPVFEAIDKTEAYKIASQQEDNIKLQSGVVLGKLIMEDQGVEIDKVQTSYILSTGGIMLLMTLLSATAAISVSYVSSKIGTGFSRRLRHDIFAKVSSFSQAEFNQFSTSSLLIRTSNDVTQVQQMIIMAIRIFFYAPIMAVGGMIMIGRSANNMTWIIIVACFAIFLILVVVYFVAVPKFKIIQKYVDRLSLVFKENLSGVMVIRAFGNKKFETNRFDEANTDSANISRFVNRVMSTMMPSMMFIMNATMLAIVYFGAKEISNGVLQIGDMMAFIQYSMQIIMSFLMISMMFIFIPRAMVSLNRINEVLTTEVSIVEPLNPEKMLASQSGVVEFKNVSFKYSGADAYVLKDLNFKINKGETTAIIGSTGSGKSSLINLIPRFYDVSEGSVSVGGVDVRNMSQHDLRETIAYVPQKGLLLSGTAEENIRYGVENASESDVLKALEISQSQFVLSKEDGLKMKVAQGGTNFSGGQKQRLSIARAIIKDASVFIFDDSFSALDFATDQKLRKAMSENLGDATLIIVAQRVNTIIDADQILVLDQGEIVGKGTHVELLKNCEAYYEIASSQMSKEELEHGQR